MLKKLHHPGTLFIAVAMLTAFSSMSLSAQKVISQNWDNKFGGLSATGWKTYQSKHVKGTDASWTIGTAKSNNAGGFGDTISPNSAPNMVVFNGFTCSAGNNAVLVSPSFDLSGRGSHADTVTVLMYRDSVDGTLHDDSLRFWINTKDSLKGATLLGTVHAPSNLMPYGGGGAWNYETFNLPAGYNTSTTNYIIIEGVSHNGPNIFLDDISWTAWPKTCSGTPNAGKVIATPPVSCGPIGGYGLSLADSGYTPDNGIKFQWQSSTNNSTWANMGFVYGKTYYPDTANTANYIQDTAKTMYYRVKVTCSASGDSAFATVTVHILPGPKTAQLPYFQGFESWMTSGCNTTTSTDDVPDTCFTQGNFTGDYSWRRDDQGSTASWSSSGKGAFTPSHTEGSHCARFHGYNSAPSSTASANLVLNFHVAKTTEIEISFDYYNYNSSGTDDSLILTIPSYPSAIRVAALGSTATKGWQSVHYYVPNISSFYGGNHTLTFRATTPKGTSVTDIGIDSLSIVATTVGTTDVTGAINKISVYPNPVTNVLSIKAEDYTKTPLYIYNAIGEVVYTAQMNGYTATVNMTELPTGIYVVKLGNAVQKVVKY